jgi:Domain of unknown function (DUF4157)
VKSSVREPLTDGPASEPVRALAPSTRTDREPASPTTAFAGGNAAIQRLASGRAPRAAPLGVLSAGGNRALHRLHSPAVQPKLSVSQPGDRFEMQADAVAARVGLGEAPAGPVPVVAPMAAPSAAAGDPGPPGLEALLANPGPGAPLPPDVRAQIEPHLGFRLGDVLVHGDAVAQAAAAQLGARAFTSGGRIFLGAGESATDLPLMAHEATHVVQQQTVGVFRLQRSSDSFLPDFVMDGVRDLARSVPGYDMLTVVAGYDPIANRTVDRSPENLVRGVMGLVPFGNVVANKLLELGILQDAFRMVDAGLTAHNLTLERIQREIDQAWDELSIDKGIDGNVAVITRHVDGLYNDALAFVRGILDQIVQLIRDAAVGLAETYLVGTPVWELTKKVLHHDPLRGTPVAAPTVEILADFLSLIGKQQALAQMQERGTLQKTADWLDVQIPRFLSLISELFALFEAGWQAIQPANLANLADNLSKLARDAIGLVQRVGAFAGEVVATVLKLIKDALLDWLSREAGGMRGFRLMTVILGQDPFTGRAVPRTAENLIGGFIALLPGGEETYRKLAEAGVIADAGAQIEGAMGRLGISLDMITGTFLSIWNSLTLEDLLNPIGAFMRVLDKFGEPLGRIVAFVGEVIKVVITLILKLMNFPSELLGSIISNAMAAIEDIQRDPVGFLLNMIAALKAGFANFLDKVLDYLLGGLADWLFRGLGALGFQKPPDLSFKSILELVLQVLDVTAEKLWTRLGKHIGEAVVQKLRAGIGMAGEVFDFIKDVEENGVGAIWKHIESQLGNLWDTLLGMAKDWIVTTIIEKATAKLLSMLDPTGIMAVINSAIAFFKAVQSVIEYVREILMIVNDYVTTLASVAAGNIGAGAAKVEKGLASAVPVAIGFLANQAGLGNIPEKLVEMIGELRVLVDKALDWLFEQAVRLGKAALNALGLGGKEEPAAEDPAADGFAVHEPVKTSDNEDHEVDNKAKTFELTMASGKPTLLSSHHDNDVRTAYQAYLDAIAAATSPTAKKEAANQHLPKILAAVKAANGSQKPEASAPGLGTIARHSAQQSKLQRGGVRVWWLESEHVIPRGFVDAAFKAHKEAAVPRAAEYNAMHTILIYEQAADRKTGGKDGDASSIAAFATAAKEIVAAAEESSVPGAHLTHALNTIRNLLNAYVNDAEKRTLEAIADENKENGASRGPKGSPEPPLPTASDVHAAADRQTEDIMAMLQKRYEAAEA